MPDSDQDEPRWCCMCGTVNPPTLEVCPVSEYEMSHMRTPGKGLTHLLAYSVHPRAVAIFERLADTRAEVRQGLSKANLTNIRMRLEAEQLRTWRRANELPEKASPPTHWSDVEEPHAA